MDAYSSYFRFFLYAFGFVYICFFLYLALMSAYTAKRTSQLTAPAMVFIYPMLVIFIVLDVLLNAVIGSVIFVESPREWLFTQRVSRLNNKNNWRGKVAKYICAHFLDPFDPRGRHCS